jgi:hypothetical protein
MVVDMHKVPGGTASLLYTPNKQLAVLLLVHSHILNRPIPVHCVVSFVLVFVQREV